MATFKLYLTTKVTDRNGRVVHKKTRASKSFVLQFLQLLETQLYGTVVSIDNTAGVAKNINPNAIGLRCNPAVTVSTYGIQVGTGATATASADYVMETLIAHGVGAGELQYGAHSKVTAQIVGANVDFQLSRTFVNGSGGGINVTEFGLTMVGQSVGNEYFLCIHDVIGAVAVANGQTLTVTYTLRTTV